MWKRGLALLLLLLLLLLRRLPIWKSGHKLNVDGTRRVEISQWCAAPDTHHCEWICQHLIPATELQKKRKEKKIPLFPHAWLRIKEPRLAGTPCQEIAVYDNSTDLIIDPFILINHWWLTETAAGQAAHGVADIFFSVVEGMRETLLSLWFHMFICLWTQCQKRHRLYRLPSCFEAAA